MSNSPAASSGFPGSSLLKPALAGAGAVASARPQRPEHRSVLNSGAVARVLIYIQISCQFLLLSGAGSNAVLRPIVRTATFATGLALIFIVPRLYRGSSHPAAKAAFAIVIILLLSLLHPYTNSWLAGTAHVALYVAILSPLFWMPRLRMTPEDLRKLFLTVWIFYSLSSALGVLQFAYPGRFQPELSSSITNQGDEYVDSLMVANAEGAMVFRPMGLTDSPGGAGVAGFYAVLVGLGLFLTTPSLWMKGLCLGSIGAGMTCLYICQVRSILIEAVLCMIILLAILVRKGRIAQVGILLVVIVVVVGGGLAFAFSLGGEAVTDRLATLTEERPDEVYYNNRGRFLDFTINELLPRFPFGAGLGRWGMMNNYFGNNSDPLRGPIYVEIQWTGWLLDGGVALILSYVAALLMALYFTWKIALSNDERFWVWGAVLTAYNIAACASTFNYAFFMSQGGMELWLLNAALYAAVRRGGTAPRPAALPVRRWGVRALATT